MLVRLEDPTLEAETSLARARVEEIRLRLDRGIGTDQVQANLLREQARHLQASLALYEERNHALTLKAPRDGLALIPYGADVEGRLVQKGEVLGYLLSEERDVRLRVAVAQDSAELVRASVEHVEFRLQRDLGRTVPARIVASAPESQPVLPSPALSTKAGGTFSLDPSDPQQRRTLESLFVFDVAPLDPVPLPMVGERALVRFDHGPEPVGFRLYRALRQLFLSQFNV
jgi:putative peptide zinc metalloprotease protein